MTESYEFKLAGYWDGEYQKFVEKSVGDELLGLEHYRIKLIPLYYKA